uniref:Uncharacterized protein n=1 Tax=Macaca fascicularis TaxID=9541 RepID=A0A7N9IDB5_MACFA
MAEAGPQEASSSAGPPHPGWSKSAAPVHPGWSKSDAPLMRGRARAGFLHSNTLL